MATRNTWDGVLERINRLNRTTVFLGTLALMLAGLFLPGILGALLLVALAAGLGLLLTRTWAYLPGGARALRLLVLAVLVIAAVRKI